MLALKTARSFFSFFSYFFFFRASIVSETRNCMYVARDVRGRFEDPIASLVERFRDRNSQRGEEPLFLASTFPIAKSDLFNSSSHFLDTNPSSKYLKSRTLCPVSINSVVSAVARQYKNEKYLNNLDITISRATYIYNSNNYFTILKIIIALQKVSGLEVFSACDNNTFERSQFCAIVDNS